MDSRLIRINYRREDPPPPLPTLELLFYFIFYFGVEAFKLYKTAVASNRVYPQLNKRNFIGGCTLLKRKPMDGSDLHWMEGSGLYMEFFCLWFLMLFTGQLLRRKGLFSWLPLMYFIFAVIGLVNAVHIYATIFMMAQPLIFFFAARLLQTKTHIWVLYFSMIAGQDLIPVLANIKDMAVGDNITINYHYLYIQGWVISRVLSYCIERINKPVDNSLWEELKILYTYAFYLPFLPGGPMILFPDFEKNYNRPHDPWTWRNHWKWGLITIFGYGLMFVAVDWWQHFFYSAAILKRPDIMATLDPVERLGMGYSASVSFFLQYIFFFGISGAFARFDGFTAPPIPKAPQRMHVFRDTWRYLDPGLYRFLSTYIHKPFLGSKPSFLRKMMAGGIVFLLMGLWHGLENFILLWITVNYITVIFIGIASSIEKSKGYQEWEKSTFSPIGAQRFKGLLNAPILFTSHLFNYVFFISDFESALTVVYAPLDTGIFGIAIFLCSYYCLYHVGHYWKHQDIALEIAMDKDIEQMKISEVKRAKEEEEKQKKKKKEEEEKKNGAKSQTAKKDE